MHSCMSGCQAPGQSEGNEEFYRVPGQTRGQVPLAPCDLEISLLALLVQDK